MSLLILGRGKRESVSIANDMRSEPHRGWFCTHRYTYIYTYMQWGGTRVEQLIGNVSKMNASMDPGISGDLNRTGWLEVVAAKVFGVKRPSCRIRDRNENPQVRRSKWSFGPVTLYNRTSPPPLSDGISNRGGMGEGKGSWAYCSLRSARATWKRLFEWSRRRFSSICYSRLDTRMYVYLSCYFQR